MLLPAACLFLVFLAFCGLFLPQTENYRYFEDDYVFVEQAGRISSNPLAGWDIELKEPRRHPFYAYFFFLELSLLGLDPAAFLLISLFIHFLNSVLVLRLSGELNVKPLASFLAGFLFLCSSTFYQVFITLMATTCIQIGLLFFLLASLAYIRFLRGSKGAFWLAILFYSLAVMNYEGTIIFPGIAVLLALSEGCRGKKLLSSTIGAVLSLFLIGFLLTLNLWNEFIFSSSVADKMTPAAWRTVIPKTMSLIRMFVVPIFTWENGFFGGALFNGKFERLVPMVLFSAYLAALFSAKRQRRYFSDLVDRRILYCGAGWIVIATLPHVLSPLTFEHATRYLYIPMVGFSLIFGVLAAAIFETGVNRYSAKGYVFLIVAIIYIGALNLCGTVFHYRRYQEYLAAHPGEDYTRQVNDMIRRRADG